MLQTALARLDHRYVWHPFTQMRDWLRRQPIVIVPGHGAVLARRRTGANIWTPIPPSGPISTATPSQNQRRHHAAARKNRALFRPGSGQRTRLAASRDKLIDQPPCRAGASRLRRATVWPGLFFRRRLDRDGSRRSSWPSNSPCAPGAVAAQVPFSGRRISRRHHRRGQPRPH